VVSLRFASVAQGKNWFYRQLAGRLEKLRPGRWFLIGRSRRVRQTLRMQKRLARSAMARIAICFRLQATSALAITKG
jgi:hypothetical protein